MAIKSKTEILEAIREKFGDDASDSTLAFLEDVSDTLDDFETKSSDSTDWKSKYDENDKAWRKKYHDRFFSSSDDKDKDKDPIEVDDGSEDKPLTYDDLFKVE